MDRFLNVLLIFWREKFYSYWFHLLEEQGIALNDKVLIISINVNRNYNSHKSEFAKHLYRIIALPAIFKKQEFIN